MNRGRRRFASAAGLGLALAGMPAVAHAAASRAALPPLLKPLDAERGTLTVLEAAVT